MHPHTHNARGEACEFFKVPCIGLMKVERLRQRLNVPTQGRRVAQAGSDP